jgi:hypothetical protein
MAKKKQHSKYQDQRRQAMKEKQELEEFELTLEHLKCSTFLKTNTKMMIPNEGVCVHKRTLWKDGRYLGIVARLLVDESIQHMLEIPPGQWGAHMPKSEYEFLYKPRSDNG